MSSTAKLDWCQSTARRVAGTAGRFGLVAGILAMVTGPAAADPVTDIFDCPELQERFELDLPPGAQPWVEGTDGVEFRLYWHPEGQWQEAEVDATVEFLTPELVRITLRDTVEYYWSSDTYLNRTNGTFLRIVSQAEAPGWHQTEGRCTVARRG